MKYLIKQKELEENLEHLFGKKVNLLKNNMETFDEFQNYIKSKAKNYPEYRFGQAVFNIIDKEYSGIARKVQFVDGVDCFYDDSNIDSFLWCCYNRIK